MDRKITMNRDGIFEKDDPFLLFTDWHQKAQATEHTAANEMALSTIGLDGTPNVRIVLLKAVEADSFVFFTNYTSVKATEILQTPQVAFVIYWRSIGRQIRVRGDIEKVDDTISDTYFDTRSAQSRLGAVASRQSQEIKSRETLLDWLAQAKEKFGTEPKRPEYWGGYRIRPLEIEFWSDGEYRLHDRFRWVRKHIKDPWHIARLSP